MADTVDQPWARADRDEQELPLARPSEPVRLVPCWNCTRQRSDDESPCPSCGLRPRGVTGQVGPLAAVPDADPGAAPIAPTTDPLAEATPESPLLGTPDSARLFPGTSTERTPDVPLFPPGPGGVLGQRRVAPPIAALSGPEPPSGPMPPPEPVPPSGPQTATALPTDQGVPPPVTPGNLSSGTTASGRSPLLHPRPLLPILKALAGGGPADGDVVVGVVNGSVTQEAGYHRFWGARILVVALIALLVSVLAQVVRDGAAGGATLVGLLRHPVSLLVTIGVVSVVTFGGSVSGRFRGVGRGTGRAGVGRAARGAASRAMGSVGAVRSTSATKATLTMRRFQVQTMTGEIYPCMLVGDLVGDEMRQGDVVRVRGRRDRRGMYIVKALEVLSSTGGPVTATVTARPPAGFTAAKIADRTCMALGLLMLFWAVLLATGAPA